MRRRGAFPKVFLGVMYGMVGTMILGSVLVIIIASMPGREGDRSCKLEPHRIWFSIYGGELLMKHGNFDEDSPGSASR